MWIATDDDNTYWVSDVEPIRRNDHWYVNYGNMIVFPNWMAESLGIDLSKLTWESEPIEVRFPNRKEFDTKMYEHIETLPYEKHVDDGQYNDGVLWGVEQGAFWAFELLKLQKQ